VGSALFQPGGTEDMEVWQGGAVLGLWVSAAVIAGGWCSSAGTWATLGDEQVLHLTPEEQWGVDGALLTVLGLS
jgi:hypothetical protein